MLNMIPILVNNYKKIANINKLEKIENALNAYILKNNKLPKPLKMKDDYANRNETTTVIDNNYLGSLPVLDLDLPLESMLDNWGNKFVYLVNKNCVDKNILDNSCNGNIQINFKNNNNIDNIVYTVVSVGKDSKGGYKKNGKEKVLATAHFNTYNTIESLNKAELKYYNDDDQLIFSTKELLSISLFWYRNCNLDSITDNEIDEGCENNLFSFDKNKAIAYRKIIQLFSYDITLEDNSIKTKICVAECTHNGILKVYNISQNN